MTLTSLRQKSLRLRGPLAAQLAAPILLTLLGVSCGDVYRPVALPIPGPSPSPAPTGHVVAVSTNGISITPSNPFLNAGWLSRIDISGDSVVTSAPAGIAPVHGTMTSSGRVYVANSGDDTVFASPVSGSIQGTVINLVQLCDNAGCPPIT